MHLTQYIGFGFFQLVANKSYFPHKMISSSVVSMPYILTTQVLYE